MIPLDGIVCQGDASVNQAAMTGESTPVHKSEDALVYAGTVVDEGEIVIRVTKAQGSGRYDRIVAMIEESEKLKSETEAKASHLADRLVPYTFGATLLTWLLTRDVTKATSILMVDYCCALKLSMPIAVLSAMREAGNHKMSLKGGKFLEAVAEAATVVRKLKEAHFDRVVMMTGDSDRTARKVAAKTGVTQYFSEVLPEDKAAFIRSEHAAGRKVIMVGDGINDSPALSEADAGIAVSSGASIAKEVADITISSDDLSTLITLKKLSLKLMDRINYNYHAIIGFNSFLIVMGMLGIFAPTTTSLLHNTSTIALSLRSMTDLLEEDM